LRPRICAASGRSAHWCSSTGGAWALRDAKHANPNPAADLDQIPTDLIERVDVVTGGASATYGSDAIAGVINFVMKTQLRRHPVRRPAGQNWHSQHSSVTQGLAASNGINAADRYHP